MITAFIFDMDGVIIDSEPIHFDVDDYPNRRFNNIELMSGYEMWVKPYKFVDEKKSFLSKILNKQRELSLIERKQLYLIT